MSGIHALLFDLDGTLLDSAPDLVSSLNWVRRSENLPPLDIAEMQRFASKGAVGLLKAGMPRADDASFEVWRQRFLEHYADNSYRDSRLYDGIPELLEFLGEAGIPWGIVTNKIEALTLPIIEAAQLAGSIGCVVCGDTLNESKPHPAPMILACKLLSCPPENCIYIGDARRDIEAGKNANMHTITARYGYISDQDDPTSWQADGIIDHPSEILKWL